MKKQEQLSINSKIYLVMDKCYEVFCNTTEDKMPPKVRLNHCHAWTQDFEEFIILWSYNNPVAVYEKSTETLYEKSTEALYDMLRGVYAYTATSAQHIAKFRHMCNPAHVLTYREV